MSVLTLIEDFSRLSKTAFQSGSEGDFETSLAASKEKLQLCNTHPRLMGNLEVKYGVLYDAFCTATLLKGQRRVKEATAFDKEFNDITVQLEFPGSFMSLLYQMLLNSPPSKEIVMRMFGAKNLELFN